MVSPDSQLLAPVRPASPEAVAEAARLLTGGALVVVPTETVYGLAARADDAGAVAAIFRAKGRPATNPLIVHVADVEHAQEFAAEWTPSAQALAAQFWPGPLTLVVQRRAGTVADAVTAGGSTVALRCPAHPVMLELLRTWQLALAAPSANPANYLSPTRVEHIQPSIRAHAKLVVDAGPCLYGIESTVVDCTSDSVRVLRAGSLTRAELSRVVTVCDTNASNGDQQAVARAPGMQDKHYSPRCALGVLESAAFENRVSARRSDGARIAAVRCGTQARHIDDRVLVRDAAEYARELFSLLHDLDGGGFDEILVEAPPSEPDWAGVGDRLRRAGG